jgi:hypothetical protein
LVSFWDAAALSALRLVGVVDIVFDFGWLNTTKGLAESQIGF